MQRATVLGGAAAAVFLLIQMAATPARADTMEAALRRAYQNNPQLNAQRATVRATDENVPQALSGYRPKVAVTASGGDQYTNQLAIGSTGEKLGEGPQSPHAVGVTVTQTLFNGNQTANKTRAAESQVLGAREGLRLMEQSVLLAAATIYMDYLRDAAILEVQRSNTQVLEVTLKQTRQRYGAGLVTPTDVAQSEAQLAAGRSQELAAEATLTTTRANFRRIIGNEPEQLAPASPVDRYLPETLQGADRAQPGGKPQRDGRDVRHRRQFSQCESQRGGVVSDRHAASQRSEELATDHHLDQAIQCFGGRPGERADLSGRRGIFADTAVEGNAGTAAPQSRAGPRSGQRRPGHGMGTVVGGQGADRILAIPGHGLGDRAARHAQEATVGQRTVLDVLNAQQALVNARVALVTAEHDRVVASYAVLSTIGRLSPQVLRLATPVYDPGVHYHQVRDNWFGVRTPDGR